MKKEIPERISTILLCMWSRRGFKPILQTEPCARGRAFQGGEKGYFSLCVDEEDALRQSRCTIWVSPNVEKRTAMGRHYDGNVAETALPQISKVYAILPIREGK